MISNASPRHSELRPSRTSITVLRPSMPAQPASLPAPAPRPTLRALWDVLKMAVGIDDDREDYECLR